MAEFEMVERVLTQQERFELVKIAHSSPDREVREHALALLRGPEPMILCGFRDAAAAANQAAPTPTGSELSGASSLHEAPDVCPICHRFMTGFRGKADCACELVGAKP